MAKHLRKEHFEIALQQYNLVPWSMSQNQIELHKTIGSPSSLGKLSSTEGLLHSTQNDSHTEVRQVEPPPYGW